MRQTSHLKGPGPELLFARAPQVYYPNLHQNSTPIHPHHLQIHTTTFPSASVVLLSLSFSLSSFLEARKDTYNPSVRLSSIQLFASRSRHPFSTSVSMFRISIASMSVSDAV